MLVSVLMSVYNSEKYLEKSIDSILNQTFKDFEFIIIDDGSTDNSKQIIEKYVKADPRIVFIQNSTNIGLPSSLNKGIQLARGEYIARQDADDFSTSDRLEIQLKYALENPHVDMVGSDSFVVDISGNVVYLDSSYSRTKNYCEKILNQQGIFPHGSAFLRKKKLNEAGLYDPRFFYTQDGEFWLRLITKGASVHIIDKPLYYYRTAPVAFTKRALAKNMFNRVLRMVYREKTTKDIVNTELRKVQSFLFSTPAQSRPYYVADYWKSLGNAAYLNGSSRSVSYKYIFKALKERNRLTNYFLYFILGLVYIFPPVLIKGLLKKS